MYLVCVCEYSVHTLPSRRAADKQLGLSRLFWMDFHFWTRNTAGDEAVISPETLLDVILSKNRHEVGVGRGEGSCLMNSWPLWVIGWANDDPVLEVRRT